MRQVKSAVELTQLGDLAVVVFGYSDHPEWGGIAFQREDSTQNWWGASFEFSLSPLQMENMAKRGGPNTFYVAFEGINDAFTLELFHDRLLRDGIS